ncbi:U3 small nucleolar RNA-associated protein 12, partial [Lecanoromycetidae sp. Uapishka_2]
MVKSYLKYEHSKTFGLIASASSNVIWCRDENDGHTTLRSSGAGRAIIGADEEVLCWDVKKGELLSRWKDAACSAEVTVIVRSDADPDLYAVGYGDGSIRIWDSRIGNLIISFNGHKSAVTTLAFDKDGVRLASGAKDTDIIVWDLVAEIGLFKLRGHKDQITGLYYLHTGNGVSATKVEAGADESLEHGQTNDDNQHAGYLLSTSKDALIKVWDIGSQHCIETHVAQSNGECWSMGVSADQSGIITAGNDGELKVWSVDLAGLVEAATQVSEQAQKGFLRERGILYRQGKDRTIGVSFHPRGSYIAAHGSDKSVELWRIRSESEIQRTMARKRKRRREKALAAASEDGRVNVDMVHNDEDHDDVSSAHITDVIIPYVIVRTSGKLHSMAWASRRAGKSLRLLLATTNNQLEMYDITTKHKEKAPKSDEPPEYNRPFSVDMPGHRTDVRSLALSSDDRMLASASNGSLKIWNVRTQSCIRTLDCGYALCATFLPGDKIVIVGNRNGELEIFDIASSTLIDTVKAHEGPIWTLNVHPDGRSMATGSADKSAKFYNFEVIQDVVPGTKRTKPCFKLAHSRTLKVSDDILSLRFSPDSRLVALSLLDNTVKVFFVDSLKLFLNLYGHKLPVLSMDISFDSKLIVTCSADKNVRLWGLDFGDCHKAFFAHQDSIMQVAFIPHNQDGNGHHFFSASKDRLIKYWDGDKFEQVQKLDNHHGEIWALAVSRTGEFLVSASHDKSIRVWNQTDEQIFLEEEREKELEELYEKTLTTSLEQDEEQGEEKSEAVAAGKQTVETLMAGEKIAEALETGIVDLEIMREYHQAKVNQPNLALPSRDPLYLAYNNISAEAHLLNVVQKIKAAALQDALLVLPFDKVTSLFTFLQIWAERQWNMPLTCRVLFFMLKTHHKQIVASKAMRTTLDEIRDRLRKALQGQKDEMGFNLAALKFVSRRMGELGSKQYVDEKSWDEDEDGIGKGRKKRGFVDVA